MPIESAPSSAAGAMATASALPTEPAPTESARIRPVALDAALIRSEWRKAANHARCAPLGFTDTGSRRGTARRADFSGGWAVAYDLPGLRSAYGVAGPGLLPQTDEQPASVQRDRLQRQWPYFVEVEQLPQPAFAGYGIEGAEAYPDANPEGRGVNSLAYLRVGGQTCTYNVWSRLGRAHLELLLRSLTAIEPA